MLSVLALASSSFALPATRAQPVVNRLVLDQGSQAWEKYVWRPSIVYQFQNSLFTMWYSGEDANGVSKIGVASSTDGLAWARYDENPVLSAGSAGSWDSGSVQESWVIFDGTTFKMWYTGERFDDKGAVASAAIGFATSPDGLHWTKFSGNPVLSPGGSGSWDSEWVFRPSVIYTGSSYMMYYQGKSTQSESFEIGWATSVNGTSWVKVAQPVSIPQAGWNSYSYLGGAYKFADVYSMLIYGSQSSTDPPNIGFARSSDGAIWTAHAAVVITHGNAGSWDEDGVILPVLVQAHNDYYIYYTGLQKSAGARIGLSTVATTTFPIPEFPAASLAAQLALLACTGLILISRRRARARV